MLVCVGSREPESTITDLALIFPPVLSLLPYIRWRIGRYAGLVISLATRCSTMSIIGSGRAVNVYHRLAFLVRGAHGRWVAILHGLLCE